MALPWDKIIGGAVTLGSALLGSQAASKAAKTTQQATQQAANTVQTQLNQSRADLEPWRKAGVNALGILTKLNTPGAMSPQEVEAQLRATPGFGFREQELQKQIDRRHAATGNRFSGRGMKEAMRWMDGNLYGPAYNQWTNDLAMLAGYGRDGTAQANVLGANAASGINQARLKAADYAAEMAVGQRGVWNNALQTLAKDLAPNPFMKAYLGG